MEHQLRPPGGFVDIFNPFSLKNLESHAVDIEIVKILAPLTDNPNAPNQYGSTPIYWAAHNGHTEIVKFLIPLADNPNTPNNNGKTPSSVAKNAEIRRILSYHE